jgi:hypothetical protein
MLLAKLGKSEVQDCIAGLKQYGYAYDEAIDHASEMQKAYSQTTEGSFAEPSISQHEIMPLGQHGVDFGLPNTLFAF